MPRQSARPCSLGVVVLLLVGALLCAVVTADVHQRPNPNANPPGGSSSSPSPSPSPSPSVVSVSAAAQCETGYYGGDCSCTCDVDSYIVMRIVPEGAVCSRGTWTITGDVTLTAGQFFDLWQDTVVVNGNFRATDGAFLHYQFDLVDQKMGVLVVNGVLDSNATALFNVQNDVLTNGHYSIPILRAYGLNGTFAYQNPLMPLTYHCFDEKALLVDADTTGSSYAVQKSIEFDIIDKTPCNISEWTEWKGCDFACGPGNFTRTRTIVSMNYCYANTCPPPGEELIEQTDCGLPACLPVDCIMSTWSQWQCDCDQLTPPTCTATRTRSVLTQSQGQGTPCPTELTQTQGCAAPVVQVESAAPGEELSAAVAALATALAFLLAV